ncbi:MAG TPA: ABC transporter ATP-binding protein [Candidatus Paceibacterota bacterium]|nr:ABC transporter ATP-binding protein [Candidatus Paceibacterota bacterium]
MPPLSTQKPKIIDILKPYWGFVALLSLCTIAGNALGLFIPKLIARGIDTFARGTLDLDRIALEFLGISLAVLVSTYLQGAFQTYLSERAARDLRGRLADKISRMSYARLEKETPSKLLTNLTSDIEAVKMLASQGVATVVSSVILIIGASALLFSIDWRLALAVLALLPIIAIVLSLVFRRLGPLFKRGQEIIDRLNGIISQSIVGAALVRVVDAQGLELGKFHGENLQARENGMRVLKLFCVVIPTVGIVANMAALVILALGGRFVIAGTLSIGDFIAFNSYVIILIFPIIMLGFVSQIVSRAQTSYARIAEILGLEDEKDDGRDASQLRGDLEVRGLTVSYGEKDALRDVSFSIPAGTRAAIVGPTAAGKTQLLYALIGLIKPRSGQVLYDGKPLESYAKDALHAQAAIVFQDSVMFNLSLRENVAFGRTASAEAVDRAIQTAELADFVASLPQGLDTMVSERGTTLSGGQKQRIMLARALALNPRILFLDDFTARVDAATEARILANLEKNYPGITLVSVTQKVQSAERFDQVILLMEGEVLAQGTHAELAESSPEYAQIVESQKSTHTYE